jgi:AraC family transcriptional regulator
MEPMAKRIMMHVAGRQRPLRLGASPAVALAQSPLLNSADSSWLGVPLELHAMGRAREAGEVGTVGDDRGVLVILEGRVDLVMREGRRESLAVGQPGSVALISSERRRQVVSMTGAAQGLALNVSSEWFTRMGFERPPADFARHPTFAPDETVFSLAQAMRTEVAAGAPTGRLFAESLSFALLSYLVERMPVTGMRERTRGRLSEGQCRRLRAHVRDELDRELGLNELAELVGLSPRHFSTLFRRAFGMSPHRYVLKQRLQEGARRLVQGRDSIAQIALDVGFSSQAHFSTAFRGEFGTTPRRYRS